MRDLVSLARLCALWALSFLPAPAISAGEEKPLRVGIVGLDTSHVVAFTRLLNDAGSPEHVEGARVVAAFPGGSPDLPASANRLERFTAELRDAWGVEIVGDIPSLCEKVDAVLLESVDGRPHLEQLKPIIAARKPVFVDKPFAGSLDDARAMARLAREAGVPCFSSSSLRFFPGIASLKGREDVGEILGCDAYSPCEIEPHHPDLYWYGVHGVEILFTLMGPGCEEVWRAHTKGQDVVVGRWRDGRIGTYRGIRQGRSGYGATVFGSKGIATSAPLSGSLYRPLVQEIVRFFRSGEPPVSLDETLEMFAFMSAADESKKRGGAPVRLSELLEATPSGAEPAEAGR
jgi:predicted dehydrogenase